MSASVTSYHEILGSEFVKYIVGLRKGIVCEITIETCIQKLCQYSGMFKFFPCFSSVVSPETPSIRGTETLRNTALRFSNSVMLYVCWGKCHPQSGKEDVHNHVAANT